MKSVEYHFCSVFRDLQLSCYALFHSSNSLRVIIKLWDDLMIKELVISCVFFVTFIPRLQLGFCLTWHGEYIYLFSYACLHWFKNYLNLLTTKNWTLVYLICLNFEFAKSLLKINYVSQKYECAFKLHGYDKLSMKVLRKLKEQVLYPHILLYKDALLFCITLCYHELKEY